MFVIYINIFFLLYLAKMPTEILVESLLNSFWKLYKHINTGAEIAETDEKGRKNNVMRAVYKLATTHI